MPSASVWFIILRQRGVSSLLAALKNNEPVKDDRRILTFQKEGYLILLGKNSFSNDRMISDHKAAHGDCLWMHATASRGSHVILCVQDKDSPPELVLAYASSLALSHSHSEARTVSVSLLKDVFKPDEAGLGVWKTSRSYSMEVPE